MSPVRVVVADDQELVRSGFTMILDAQPDLVVVGEAGDGDEGIELVRRVDPDIVLMDIRMPGKDGLAATEELSARPNPPKVVVLTTFGEESYVYRALRAGAVGFLLKDTPPEELVTAVRRAADGLAVLDPAITQSVIAHFTDPGAQARSESQERLSVLTAREREVLACLGEGMSNAEIGARLKLSETTVKSHVSKLMEKLACANRTQAAILAYEAGLVHG